MIKKIVRRIKARIRKIRAAQKLKKSGCSSWRDYRHLYDPNINCCALRISQFYWNYNYIWACDYSTYQLKHGYKDWCEKHCRFRYRADWLRVLKDQDDWYINELGCGDVIFFAFMDEGDYVMFLLRWA